MYNNRIWYATCCYSKAIHVQKSLFFTCYDVALLFWVFSKLSGLLLCSKISKVQYSISIDPLPLTHCVIPFNIDSFKLGVLFVGHRQTA